MSIFHPSAVLLILSTFFVLSSPLKTENLDQLTRLSSETKKRDANNCDDVQGDATSPSVGGPTTCMPLGAQGEEEKLIRVSIKVPNFPGKTAKLALGSSITIGCRMKVASSEKVWKGESRPNLKHFRLRWLKCTNGTDGRNQSIISTELDSSTVIIVETTRVWTNPRNLSSLDLEIQDYQSSDVGDYYCQAFDVNAPEVVIGEAHIELSSEPLSAASIEARQEFDASAGIPQTVPLSPLEFYSPENLAKLIPSLRVVPDYAELDFGDSIQLVCMSRSLEQIDPEASSISWNFEAFDRLALAKGSSKDDQQPKNETADDVYQQQQQQQQQPYNKQLPANVDAAGATLTINSMTQDHRGLYKCSVHLEEFNLSSEASAEVTLRPAADSAPLVQITPELVRLSPNGSALLQCEVTGYPAPDIEWYRVESLAQEQTGSESKRQEGQAIALTVEQTKLESIGGLRIEHISSRDALVYCELFNCSMRAQTGASSKPFGGRQVTGISLIHLRGARAQHQGQYVCRASNKHGSNQASALVDVEFRLRPQVRIATPFRRQTIELGAGPSTGSDQVANITFKCSLEAGQPAPKLRWLRTATVGGGRHFRPALGVAGSVGDELDLYDLTKVSSASSRISTWFEDAGKTLVLNVATISADDEGDYVCLAENELGRAHDVARLQVRRPISVRIEQSSPVQATEGDTLQLECLASGHPPPADLEWSRAERGVYFALVGQYESAGLGTSSGLGGVAGSQQRALLKFDRVAPEEAGEYTCSARDPLNGSLVVRDTIQVLVERNFTELGNAGGGGGGPPTLIARPASLRVPAGSNVSIDCLAVAGLQPTLIEWLAPQSQALVLLGGLGQTGSGFAPLQIGANSTSLSSTASIARLPMGQVPLRLFAPPNGPPTGSGASHLFQFGSRLRLFNVQKAHEGLYQCKGVNQLGADNVPALLSVVEPRPLDFGGVEASEQRDAKTKVAKLGSNIELKCRVEGSSQLEQQTALATSWSRDGRELPRNSVQIGSHLWIQNVSSSDEGLYVCLARSRQHHKVIQAKIRLLVRHSEPMRSLMRPLEAKVVPSKSEIRAGDSLTLECIISLIGNNSNPTSDSLDLGNAFQEPNLEQLERDVIWTNQMTGSSSFPDNVYIVNNLLIIYDLRQDNEATYRCNYNDLTQHADFRLELIPNSNSMSSPNSTLGGGSGGFWQASTGSGPSTVLNMSYLVASNGRRAQLRRVNEGSPLRLDCLFNPPSGFIWLKGNGAQARAVGQPNKSLEFEAINSSDADVYHCLPASGETNTRIRANNSWTKAESYLVQVLLPVARFTQRPVSFVTLPTLSKVEQQLELEIKFLPERASGLLLFSGQLANISNNSSSNRQVIHQPTGDFVLLGLNEGYLEFKFELGDGATSLRSALPVSLNQWHRVLVSRQRRVATMMLDSQAPISNSSSGKFFDLNLDSVLYIGGHPSLEGGSSLLNGYSTGFSGCLASLRLGQAPVSLIFRNRGVSVGISECQSDECAFQQTGSSEPPPCGWPDGLCQVERPAKDSLGSTQSGNHNLRCLCLPGFFGPHCNSSTSGVSPSEGVAATRESPAQNLTSLRPQENLPAAACKLQVANCDPRGTIECRSLSSTSFKCLCKIGFSGPDCSHSSLFGLANESQEAASETGAMFQQQGFIQLRFNKPEEAEALAAAASAASTATATGIGTGTGSGQAAFNVTHFTRSISMTETQEFSFKLQTRSSYGLLLYMGAASPLEEASPPLPVGGAASALASNSDKAAPIVQHSKSVVANLLARLSNTTFDFLAISLIDGHLELSFELGSGVGILRSSQRLNDGLEHAIQIQRQGRKAQLTIDELFKHETHSPGRLNMLNVPLSDGFYLGGIPAKPAELANSLYISGFTGCLSELEINSLGPLNLFRSSHLTELRNGRNVAKCDAATLTAQAAAPADLGALSRTGSAPSAKKPIRGPSTQMTGVDSDDPDEM